jgi:thymidylate synthase
MSCYQNEGGYLQLLKDVKEKGDYRITRNGYVYSIFSPMITFDNINNAFPLLTTKKMFIKGIIEELLWFLRGSTDAKELQEKGIHIWDGNSSREYLDSVGLHKYQEGELGPVYGFQWRNFGKTYGSSESGFDQIKYIIEELMKPSNSRRAILSAWNPSQLNEMALPPCHLLYTFYKDDNGLSCLMNMRSSDVFLGLPFNIASTAFLTHIIAKVLHIIPYKISIVATDSHLYEEHISASEIQLKNNILTSPLVSIIKEAPSLESPISEKLEWISSLTIEDFCIENYKSADIIKAPMK